MKPPVLTKRATVILIKVKSRNALLLVLLVGTGSYLKAVLKYKFVILGTYQPDTIYLRGQGCEDPWLSFEAKRGLQEIKKNWETVQSSIK